MDQNFAQTATPAENALPPIAIRSIRNKTALSLHEPDRVPFMPSMNNFYALHYGVTVQESPCHRKRTVSSDISHTKLHMIVCSIKP